MRGRSGTFTRAKNLRMLYRYRPSKLLQIYKPNEFDVIATRLSLGVISPHFF